MRPCVRPSVHRRLYPFVPLSFLPSTTISSSTPRPSQPSPPSTTTEASLVFSFASVRLAFGCCIPPSTPPPSSLAPSLLNYFCEPPPPPPPRSSSPASIRPLRLPLRDTDRRVFDGTSSPWRPLTTYAQPVTNFRRTTSRTYHHTRLPSSSNSFNPDTKPTRRKTAPPARAPLSRYVESQPPQAHSSPLADAANLPPPWTCPGPSSASSPETTRTPARSCWICSRIPSKDR